MNEIIEEVKVSKKEVIKNLEAKVAQLEKDLKQQTEYKEMYQRREQEACRELDDIHDFLDGLPDSLPKEKPNYGKYSVTARLLSWIAKKSTH